MHRQEELEQADLEAALAMSLAIEDERARLREPPTEKSQPAAVDADPDSPKASSRKVRKVKFDKVIDCIMSFAVTI